MAVRTGEQMGVNPIDTPLEVFIIPWTWGRYLGHDSFSEGVDVRVSSWRRPAPDTLPTMAKAGGNYLISQLSKMEAKMDGYAEGIMLDSFGLVSEGSGENLFVVRDNSSIRLLCHRDRTESHATRERIARDWVTT